MNKKGLMAIFTILLLTVCLTEIGFAAEEAEIKLDSKIINIDNGLDPAMLTAKPGTTVIWVNNSSDPVEIRFMDKKVSLACGAPVNFVHDAYYSGYESSKIFRGGIASLCFVEKGKYEYVYKVSSTDITPKEKEYKGTIVIE